MTGARRAAVLAGLVAVWALSSCGGGGGEASAPDTAGDFGSGSAEVASTGAASDSGTGSDGDGGTPFGEEDSDGDGVQFVTTSSGTTTTTTLPLTTTTTTTSTTTTSTTSTTSTTTTTTTTPPPTTIRCSFAADALFEPGEAVLTDQAVADLGNVVSGITDIRGIRVEGHTDHRGTDDENLALSQARADAAAAALVDAGIDASLITAAGLGESEADQDDPTDAEMAADRRVDVVVDADVPITTTC